MFPVIYIRGYNDGVMGGVTTTWLCDVPGRGY